MYRVMLVDDEIEIREGIRYKIDWQSAGFIIAGEAGDGIEALNQIEAVCPDVLITDIRMPKMDGLELLRICAERYPKLKLVVLSGYDDFEFAKKAIQSGAKDFLLKPVKRVELTSLLERLNLEFDVYEKQTKERSDMLQQLMQSKFARQETLLLKLIQGVPDEGIERELLWEAEEIDLGFIWHDRMKRFIIIEVEAQEGDYLYKLAFRLMSRELIASWRNRTCMLYDQIRSNVIHLLLDSAEDESLCRRWIQHELLAPFQKFLKTSCRVGIGAPFNTIDGIRIGFWSARQAWSQAEQSNMHSLKADYVKKADPMLWNDEIKKELSHAVEHGQAEVWNSITLGVIDQYKNGETDVLTILNLLLYVEEQSKRYLLQLTHLEQMIWQFPESILNPEATTILSSHLEQWWNELNKANKLMLRSSGENIVEAVQAYVDEHYSSEELSLSFLANKFHIHSTYLSELFKKKIGQNYSEYVIDIRLSHAQRLLKETNLKITDVSELVGFSNANYFSSVFKKEMGLSPNEYRLQYPKAHFDL